MTSLLVPWLAFPLLLAALSLCCGLLLERGAGLRLPGPLLLPCGYALLVVIALFATTNGTTARLAMPAVVVAAVAGLVLTRRRPPVALDLWAVAAGVGVFAVYAAPVVLSGHATFPGYIKLDDDSTFLANLDRAMHHGRDISGLAPSTYLASLQPHLAKGYPLGAVIPIGVGREVVGGDTLWLYQPCTAFAAAMLGLALYALGTRVIRQHWLRALAGFVGAQSALLYGYALWGGLKEVAAAAMVALAAALIPPAFRRDSSVRAFLPLATASAALLGILSAGGFIWLVPALATALVAVVLTRSRRAAVRTIVALACFGVVLSIPTIVAAPSFLGQSVFTYDYLANLVAPLNSAQIVGIWPTGDFRFPTDHAVLTGILIGVTVVAAIAGLLWAVRRKAWELPVYVAGTVASCFLFFTFSTPWIDGKALATASAAIPVAAIAGCAPLFARGMRLEGSLLAAVITGAVLWSNVLQYHDAWLAPRAQLTELQWIGNHFAGDGPSLITEYQPYGARHFLRKLDGEGASELRIRPVTLRTGQLLPKGAYANIDDFQLDAVLVYRTLVLRRSPAESRPPSDYSLAWRGKFYEVWQRPVDGGRRILDHLSLGDDRQPTTVPSCSTILDLAQRPGTTAIATVERPPAVYVGLGSAVVPHGWGVSGSDGVVPDGKGTLQTSVQVPSGGRYGLWLGGSFRDRLEVMVDGRRVETMRNQLNNGGQYTPLGSAVLRPGPHTVELRYSGPDLMPGSAGAQFPLGPLVLSTTTADLPVTYVRPGDARSLCGRNLDWVEALGA